jgi:transposase-like protein/IS1 family transposase
MVGDSKAELTMTCKDCDVKCQRFGKHRNGLRRFRCPHCKKTYTEPHRLTLGEMYVSEEKILLAIQLLIEGNSIRSTTRITGVDGNTIMKALALAGDRCEKVMARLIVLVPVKDVQCDEIWSFIFKKQKAVEDGDDPNYGDYCFTAIERHSKLILNFALGKRDQKTCDAFIEGLRHATASQNFQVTTDGFAPYRSAIDTTLSDRVDFAQLIKVYRASVEGEGRYSPAEVVSTEVVPVVGNPEPDRICTSHVERQNSPCAPIFGDSRG